MQYVICKSKNQHGAANGLLHPAVIYLLAWIASSQTAAPRNDLFESVIAACEAIRHNVYVVTSDTKRKVVSWVESLELSSTIV